MEEEPLFNTKIGNDGIEKNLSGHPLQNAANHGINRSS
jgi:hypothetical protein